MALRKCRECGSQVSSRAATCPQCGAPTKRKTNPLVGLLAFVIIIAVCAGVCTGVFNLGDKTLPSVGDKQGSASRTPTGQATAEQAAPQLAAAEAKRRAEKQRQAEEKAKREAAEEEVRDRLDAYIALLNAAEVKLINNVSVERIGDDIWEATLTVDNLWHIRHHQIRLQDAQTLWEAWARIASPEEPDKARIKLADLRGNEVGGSRVWGGSLIWVKED